MTSPGLTICCVEDHEPDAVLIRAALEHSPHASIDRFIRAIDLKSLDQIHNEQQVDVVLLDLGLPDSAGLSTIARARAIVQATPLVVLTGDDRRGLESISAGADDFVAKDHIGDGHLARTLSHAVERHRLNVRVSQMESERELVRIGEVGLPTMPVAQALVGNQRLTQTDPGFAQHCVETFTKIVADRLTSNAIEAASPDQRLLRSLSRQMASRNAGPEDVVVVLTAAVDNRRGQLRPSQFGPFVRECRLALIELMGHLMALYRAQLPLHQTPDDTKLVVAGAPPAAVIDMSARSTSTTDLA